MLRIRIERSNGMASCKVMKRLPVVGEALNDEIVSRINEFKTPRNGYDAYINLVPFPEDQ